MRWCSRSNYAPEPSSRSLCYDFEDIEPDENETPVTWCLEPALPTTLKTLILVEGFAACSVFKSCVIKNTSVVGQSKPLGVTIYQLSQTQYVCVIVPEANTTHTEGEYVQLMSEWFTRAELVLAFRSLSLVPNYLTHSSVDLSGGVIRSLSNHFGSSVVKCAGDLEMPNIVSGHAAAGVTYRECLQKQWQLNVWYLASAKYLDGNSVGPFCKLLNDWGVSCGKFDGVVPMDRMVSTLYL